MTTETEGQCEACNGTGNDYTPQFGDPDFGAGSTPCTTCGGSGCPDPLTAASFPLADSLHLLADTLVVLLETEAARTDDVQARLDALVDVAYAAVRAWTPALLEEHLNEHHPRTTTTEVLR